MHVWASLLKLWLRELPTPLIDDNAYAEAIAIATAHLIKTKERSPRAADQAAKLAAAVLRDDGGETPPPGAGGGGGGSLSMRSASGSLAAVSEDVEEIEVPSSNVEPPPLSTLSSDSAAGGTPRRPRQMKRRKSVFSEVEDAKVEGQAEGAALKKTLSTLFDKLMPLQRKVLEVLLGFLRQIDPVASRMPAHNVAIIFAPCCFRNADLMAALANAQKEILFVQLLLDHAPLPPESAFAADRAAFYSLVAAVHREAPRVEMFAELCLAGSITAEERDMMVLPHSRLFAPGFHWSVHCQLILDWRLMFCR